MNKRPSDQVVFVTGAARGIGADLARRLDAAGARLLLTDLDAAALRELAATLDEDRVLAVVADVRDLQAMQSAVDAAIDRFGGIDVVVANAGIFSYGSVLQVDPGAFKTLIEVNVLGVFHTVRAALPSVIDRAGYVLVVSSLAAYAAAPGIAAYNASKAAIEHFANALRLEVAHQGVEVGSAHMSWIDTPLVQEVHAESSAFRDMLTRLPGPLRKTTSVEACGEAFVRGIAGRKRRIDCPGWVGWARWLRPLLSTPLGEAPMRTWVPELLPRMDAEVAARGRSLSARIEALEQQPTNRASDSRRE